MNETSALTRALRTGIATDPAYGAVIPPLHMSTTYAFEGYDTKGPYDYSRSGNPTRDLLAEALTTLEGGVGTVVTASGMAAVTLVLFGLCDPGDLVAIPHDAYGGTWRIFLRWAERKGIELEIVDFSDDAAVDAMLARKPRLVWLETPSNPLCRLTDIRALADRSHAAGAVVVVDNTFCTPIVQRPIEHGADIVVHSTTKYVNGHSDVVGGAVVSAGQELHDRMAEWGNTLGVIGSPFDSYQALRGLRTLHLRMQAHQANGLAAVELLSQHPAVSAVHHPSLPTHPDHELAGRQMDGYGAMLSFELAGGLPAVGRFIDAIQGITLAESLGGTESLFCHPATMTHRSMTPEARTVAGISDSLLRLSIGIEPTADVVGDLRRALDAVKAGGDA